MVLVNKYKYLPKDYKPSDLVYINGAYGNKVALREIVKDDFIRLQKAAKDEFGITLMPTSAYRSYSTQKALYEKYVKQDGKEKADTYSARPGHSEHQTGLAIDLKNMALKKTRLSDKDYEWLENNAHKYGFIVRYQKGKEQITGYMFEPWHIRYLPNIATKVKESGLTYEEWLCQTM